MSQIPCIQWKGTVSDSTVRAVTSCHKFPLWLASVFPKQSNFLYLSCSDCGISFPTPACSMQSSGPRFGKALCFLSWQAPRDDLGWWKYFSLFRLWPQRLCEWCLLIVVDAYVEKTPSFTRIALPWESVSWVQPLSERWKDRFLHIKVSLCIAYFSRKVLFKLAQSSILSQNLNYFLAYAYKLSFI